MDQPIAPEACVLTRRGGGGRDACQHRRGGCGGMRPANSEQTNASGKVPAPQALDRRTCFLPIASFAVVNSVFAAKSSHRSTGGHQRLCVGEVKRGEIMAERGSHLRNESPPSRKCGGGSTRTPMHPGKARAHPRAGRVHPPGPSQHLKPTSPKSPPLMPAVEILRPQLPDAGEARLSRPRTTASVGRSIGKKPRATVSRPQVVNIPHR